MYLETDDATVLIDPLVPPEDSERFLEYLDADVERAASPVHILLTVYWHVRSSAELAERYKANVWAPARSAKPVERRTASAPRAIQPGDMLPGNVEAHASGRAAELVYLLPHRRARGRRRAARRPAADLPRTMGGQGRPAGRPQGAAAAARPANRPRAHVARRPRCCAPGTTRSPPRSADRQSSGSSEAASTAANSTSRRSIRVPSTSTTVKCVPSCATSSPGSGARPRRPKTKPAIVW